MQLLSQNLEPLPIFGCQAEATTYASRLSATYDRLFKVLTAAELKLACDKHAAVVANTLSARNALYKLRDEYPINEMRQPLSKLKAIDTFKSLGDSIERSIVEIGKHNELLTARESCEQLMQAIDALHGEHGHPDAHEAIVMRNVVGKPGTLDVEAACSGHTTRTVDGTVYTVLTPRRAHFGAVGPIFKPRDAGAGQVRSGFAQAPERIGTITTDNEETIQEFRRATDAANIGEFLGIMTGGMLRALGTPGAVDGQRTIAQINVPEPELLALIRVWNIIAGEVSECHNEDRHLLLRASLLVHVESKGTTGGWLYQVFIELTERMWDKLARSLHPRDLEHFLTNIERSVHLMTKTAPQGTFLYFRLDETSEACGASETPETSAASESAFVVTQCGAESKRNSDDTLDNAATKRPCCRDSTEL